MFGGIFPLSTCCQSSIEKSAVILKPVFFFQILVESSLYPQHFEILKCVFVRLFCHSLCWAPNGSIVSTWVSVCSRGAAQSAGDSGGAGGGQEGERGKGRQDQQSHPGMNSGCEEGWRSLHTGTVSGPGELHRQPPHLDSEPGPCSS